MSNLFGGGGSNAQPNEVYAGIQVTTSILGQPVPFVAGRQRVAPILIWYGGFQAIPQSQGGKGGNNNSGVSYTYVSSFIVCLGLGPAVGINRIWNGKKMWDVGQSQNLLNENLALSLGGAAFTGSISGTTLTASGVIGFIQATSVLAAAGVTPGTTIVSQLTGTAGGAGTYQLSASFSVASEAMTSSQVTWGGYPAGTPAGQQIPYSNMVTAASTGYQLGSSASMPNLNFEFEGCVPGYSDAHAVYDADPTDVIPVYLQHPVFGAGFAGTIQNLKGSTNTVQAYVMSLGLLSSPYENSQRSATDFLKELLQVMNCDGFVSVGQLKILPLGDQAVSGTTPDGANWSWAPSLTPVFAFNDDDYCPKAGETPVKLVQKALNQTHNAVNVQYKDRANYYNDAPVNCSLINDIALTGYRLMSQLTFPQITNAATALMVGQLILQADRYEINTYEFRVPQDFCQMEPNDPISLTDSTLGLAGQVCRVLEVEDDGEDFLNVRALEIPGVVRTTPQYNWAAAAGYFANYATAPGTAQAPVIFPLPAALALPRSSGVVLGIAVCGQTQNVNWKGCMVFCSFDGGNTYAPVGQVGPNGPARYGVLAANVSAVADPDTTSTLKAMLANTTEQLSTAATHAQADAGQELILVDSGSGAEFMSYGTGALVSAGLYNLTYLRRNLYGSANGAHTGASFTGAIAATTLTISGVTGTVAIGQTVLGAGVLPGTKITAGSGLSWTVNNSQTVTSEAMVSGVPFVRVDGSVFQMSVDYGYAGQTLFFKFCSFNTWGQANELLANVPAYSYVVPIGPLGGAAQMTPRGSASLTPTGLLYKATGGSAAWDTDCVSLKPYASCSVSAQVAVASQQLAVGLVASTGSTLNPTTNMDYALYANAGTYNIYEGGVSIGSFGSVAAGDLALVTYDGFFVRYWVNGALQRAVPKQGASLFIGLALFTAGAVWSNVATGPFTPVTPTQYTTVGTAIVNDTDVGKPSGSAAWDSAAVSIVGYTSCHIAGKTNDVGTSAPLGRVLFGLCTPAHEATILAGGTTLNTLVDYAWYSNENQWQIVEAGTTISTPSTTASLQDKAWITYDGTNVKYYLNDPTTAVRTVAVASLTLFGAVLPFDATSACGINSLGFGPSVNLKLNDTAELGLSAATITDVAHSTPTGVSLTGVTGNTALNPTMTMPNSPNYACTAIVTMNITARQSAGTVGDVSLLVLFADDGVTKVASTSSYKLLSASDQQYTLQWEFSHTAANVGKGQVWAAANPGNAADTLVYGPCTLQVEYVIR